ncbi:MAG TPA: OmpA family protein [Bryobacteraceae bacterium]|nr:OmpA family protein [Bryobacteraceae bacterium]
MKLVTFAFLASLPFTLHGQTPNPMQNTPQPGNGPGNSMPIYRVEVVSRSVPAVSYRDRSGWTKIDFQGTSLAPNSKGTAQVRSQLGHMEVKLDVKDLPAPRSFGPLYLTYVLWAITPDGHPTNMGEVVVDSDGKYSGTMTTELQAFGLIITAEPYWAVRQPSDVVAMQNFIRTDTQGKWEMVNAKYELLPRGNYTYHVPETQLKPVDLNSSKKSPLELYEAQNAVQIAEYAKADQYAPEQFQNAQTLWNQAEDYTARKEWKPANMTAKEAVEKAEDARVVSLRKQEQLARDQERQEAADRQAAAERHAREQAERAQQAQQQAQLDAQQRAEAERAQRQSEQARQEADAARAQASQDADKAQQQATEANRLREQAEQQREQLRAQLLQQFNAVLPTRETSRGLVVNMQDVLFATAKYQLNQQAQLALARIAGIIVSHPGLNIHVEGYTDSTGSVDFNQKLSEQRADTVKNFLISQGVNPQTVTDQGYGESYPVASNETSQGRHLNRRVELVVSGEIIGVQIGVPPSQTSNPGLSSPGATVPPQPQPGVPPPANPPRN